MALRRWCVGAALAGCWALAAGAVGCHSAAPRADEARAAATPINPALTGSIRGQVTWLGAAPAVATIDTSGAPGCGQSQPDPSLVVNGSGKVRWAFVYIKAGLEHWRFAVPAAPVVLDQKGCRFEPHVFGIQAGQLLRVVSSDATIHNVHAESKRNPPWNESMAPGMGPIEERFTQPEIMVPIRCNVHAWMSAYAGVLANPYFAVTGADGSYALQNVPAGTYTLAVWQERNGEREQTVTVLPRQTAEVDFQYGSRAR